MADPTQPGPQIPLIYANHMAMSGNPFDAAIDFGYRSPTGEIGWAARIAMTWEHASILRDALNQSIERYEQQFGPTRDVKAHVQLNVSNRTTGEGGDHDDGG